MDELAEYNRERWNELAKANVEYSRPWLSLDDVAAIRKINRHGFLGRISDTKVLCLAAGGGQQSAAFGVLGAHVTVLDISETQLDRDRKAAAHYGYQIETVQGDMRDLSMFGDESFDIVWQSYSISFVSEVRPVFDEVSRVIRHDGFYRIGIGNPFTFDTVDEEGWNGESYPLKYPYIDGAEVTAYPNWGYWDVETESGETTRIEGPKEFHHNLSTVLNGIIRRGFVILGIWEDQVEGGLNAEPGSWDHYTAFAPPYLHIWARYRPDILGVEKTTASS